MCSGYLHSNVALWKFLLQIPNSGDFPMHHHHHWRHNHRTTTTPGVVHFKHQLSIWCSHHHLIMQKGWLGRDFGFVPLSLTLEEGGWVMGADKARKEAEDREESSQEERRRNPQEKLQEFSQPSLPKSAQTSNPSGHREVTPGRQCRLPELFFNLHHFPPSKSPGVLHESCS